MAGSISYLFTACLACSLLGAAMTFGPTGLYPAYLHPQDSLGILPLSAMAGASIRAMISNSAACSCGCRVVSFI